MATIDYAALARAAWNAERAIPEWGEARSDKIARAVVAALRDQGFVVVRRDDVAMMEHDILENAGAEWETTYREVVPDLYYAVTRVGAALAAPGDGETT